MKIRLLFLLIVLSILFSEKIKAGIEDACGTTSGSAAPYLPTSGTIKVYVIFAQFQDDPNTDDNGWAKDEYPDWANTFVNSSTGGTYPWDNLSHYFNEMSNETYQVIGDVYDDLVTTDYDQSHYATIGEANREIIMEVAPSVNFADYDNLNGSSPGTDGKVDFIYIIYRNVTGRTLMDYSGIAHLNVSSTITDDGKQIVNNSSIGGGVQQRGGYNGRDYTLYVAAHEMGHYLFGGSHISYATNLCLMSNTGFPVWNGSKGMHSWERQKLGWISYTDKTTDDSETMSDYMTQDQVFRVPVSATEYYLIENRKKQSPHDYAGDTGFYFYRVTNPSSFPPAIDVLCADGNWNFNFNSSTLKITKLTPNPTGSTDEMNVRYLYDSDSNGESETYACYMPVYHEDAAWGDAEDAFDQTFNNVFSPKSNPRNTSSLEFSIEVTGTDQITFYFDGDGNGDEYAGSPSKPQNLQVASNGTYPVLTWDANTEPDISTYQVVRKMNSGSWTLIATVSTNSYTDTQVITPVQYDHFYYKVCAKDNQNYYSVFSNEVSIDGYKIYKNNEFSENETQNKIEEEFLLLQNYPNPFNPTTKISFTIPEAGFVTLKVYDILGRDVATLINEGRPSGKYEVDFDASQLPSGTYVYRLITGKQQIIKKMLLLK